MSYFKIIETIIIKNSPKVCLSINLPNLDDNIFNLILDIIRKTQSIEINLFLNTTYNIKNFIFTKSLFKKLNILINIKCVNIYTTLSENMFIYIDNKYFLNIDTTHNINKSEFIDIFKYSSKLDISNFSKTYINYILSKPKVLDNDMLLFLLDTPLNLSSKTIPQFSNFYDGCINVIKSLLCSDLYTMDFVTLGKFLNRTSPSDVARKKYGENHAKFCELLDFCYIHRSKSCNITLTQLGINYIKLTQSEMHKILLFQMHKLDIIQLYYLNKYNSTFDIKLELTNILKPSTANRRLSNVNTIIKFIESNKESL